MNIFNKTIYNLISLARNSKSINIVNKVANIDNYNLIIPNLYLGNIKAANDFDFLKNNKIEAIINCTENEPFHEYFNNKSTFRLSINDSKDPDNINKFKKEIIDSVEFINNSIESNKPVFVHCYWGLMRSATVVTAYLIKKYKMDIKDAINIVREQRSFALLSLYNFNEVLEHVKNLDL
jgi:protein-tyrosine phosphatase